MQLYCYGSFLSNPERGHRAESVASGLANIVIITGVGLLLAFSVQCGILDGQFQGFWKRQLMDVVPVVQAYIAARGRLPDSLDQALLGSADKVRRNATVTVGSRTIDLIRWVHYRKIGEREYQLWLRRADIENGFRYAASEAQNEGPERGDVFAQFDLLGNVTKASWNT